MIIAANPSTLVNLARAGDAEKESLIRDIHDGTLSDRCNIPAEVRTALARRIGKAHPERAKALEEIVNRTGNLYPKDYWPRDCINGNWMGGSVGAYLRHFPKYYGETPCPRCWPHRQRRTYDHPDVRWHAERRSRRYLACL